jgi:hypothetical protein
LDGDTALIGEPGDHENGLDSCAVYFFTRSGTEWSEEAKFLPSDGVDRDSFGGSVSLVGDTAIIGASGTDDNGEGSGSAYIFRRIGSIWSEQVELLPTDGATNDRFGNSVSLDDETILIGALCDDDNTGSSYIFEKSMSDLTCQESLSWNDVPPGGYVQSFFTVENMGKSCSFLNWEMVSCPDWGIWIFSSDHGYLPLGESEIIDVHVLAPLEPDKEFTGEIKIVNKDNISDFEIIPVYLKTPRNSVTYYSLLLWFLDHFPMLEKLLGLIRLI